VREVAFPALRRPAAIVAIWVVVLLGAPASATHAATPAALLARHAPILVLHPQERFKPERVDGFLADSDLVDGHYDTRACKAVGGPAALECYVAADRAHGQPPALYGAVFRTAGRTVLEYWLFYPFNLYTYANPLGSVWQSHEGDWEAIVVVLDKKSRPAVVGVSQHCTGSQRAWAKVEKKGSRPIVYVALGSHTNAFAPGSQPIASRCLPSQAQTLLSQYGVTLTDDVRKGRKIAQAAIVRITAATPEWMRFPGPWGEAQYVQIPNQQPIAFGFGPTGPATHALWRQPLAVVGTWPRG
jgi:hypothetical protein